MRKKANIFKFGVVFLASFAINIWAAKPTVKISASPASIFLGSASTLTWTSTGATSASINQGIGSVAVNGSKVVSPTATTTYSITAKNSSGTTTSTVMVTVKAAPPTVSFSAAPTSIAPGGSATLSWTTTNATSASINQGIGSVAVNGSKVVSPTATTAYTITAKNSSGTTTAKVTITVKAAPPTVTFSAAPTSIAPGGSATLSWTTTGATSASIDQSIGTVALNGSKVVKPTTTKTYTITVKGSGGMVTAKATVTVAAVKPTVTISAEPTTIQPNESSTLTWTSTNATSAAIDNNIGNVQLNSSTTVFPAISTTYTITVSGPDGGTANASTTVTVNQPQPQVSLKAFPTAVLPGELSTLFWQTTNVDSTNIDNGVGDVPSSGSIKVSLIATTTYTITATGLGGMTNATVTISVDDTLKPSAAIYSSLEIVAAGGSTVLNWSSLHAQSASIDNGIGAVPINGSQRVTPAQTTTYTLSAVNQNGTASASVKVVFMPAPKCFAYVPNSYDNTVSVVNTIYSGSVVKTIAVGVQPRGSAVSPDGTRVYVGNAISQSLSVIDTGSNTVLSTIGLGGGPKYLALHPSGKVLYATLEKESSFAIAMINTANGQVLKELDLGTDYLGGIAVHPDGNRLYAAFYGGGKVLVINTVSNEIISQISLRTPIDLAVSPDGNRLYVIQGYDGYKDNVSIIDTATQGVVSSLRVRLPNSVSASLVALELLPDGSKLYVTISDNNGVSVIDTSTLLVTKAESFAGYAPKCLATTPDGSKIYVIFSFSNYLVYYYSDSGRIGFWIAMGGCPLGYGNFIGYMAETAAGKVTQNSTGVAGVTLTISGEGLTKTVVTDADGNYITALKSGIYTITPAKGSMVFSPQSRQVTIDQSMSGRDFMVIDPAVPPTVSLSASPVTIQAGSTVTLSWTSTNAATAEIDSGVGAVPVSGSKTVTPDVTTTYTITVSNTVLTATASAVVTVTSPPPAVIISATPAAIASGGSSTLTWTSINAVSATIDNGIGAVPVNGSQVVTPSATSTYKIIVTGPGGSANASVMVTISEPPPTVTIIAAPDAIPPGGSSTLTWTTINATSATIDQGIGAVQLNGSLAVKPALETIYNITATGPGGTTIANVTVRMLDSLLRGVWNGMKTAMLAGNVDQAVAQYSDQTRGKYQAVFMAIADQLPQIVGEMMDIEPVYFEEFGAKYRIKRTEVIEGITYDITYYIYFVQEEDGSWKILNY